MSGLQRGTVRREWFTVRMRNVWSRIVAAPSARASTPLSPGGITRPPTFPDRRWAWASPAELGLDAGKLDALRDHAWKGCVVRYGYMVKSWGNTTHRLPGGSETKPFFTHWMFKAVEEGKLSSIEDFVHVFEPRLNDLPGDKDRHIRWRHMAMQISGYSVTDWPGSAFDYNDYNMALFGDTLLLKVWGAQSWSNVHRDVVEPRLGRVIQFQDGARYDSNGRFRLTLRDLARFGLLYMRKGNWKGAQLISEQHAVQAVTSPLPASFPNSEDHPAPMIPGQRSMGSFEGRYNLGVYHHGSYSFAWWTNGRGSDGQRRLPDAPADTFGAIGCCGSYGPHGARSISPRHSLGMYILPGLGLILVWAGGPPSSRLPDGNMGQNAMLRTLVQAVTSSLPPEP
jgi:CubicO group peptidase (beta-lactamase class C family)